LPRCEADPDILVVLNFAFMLEVSDAVLVQNDPLDREAIQPRILLGYGSKAD